MAGEPSPLIEELWRQFRPLVDERLRQLQAYADGGGDLELAARSAHNLAGSLGSYGRAAASPLAQEIDRAFAAGPPDRTWLEAAVGRLRAALDVEPG